MSLDWVVVGLQKAQIPFARLNTETMDSAQWVVEPGRVWSWTRPSVAVTLSSVVSILYRRPEPPLAADVGAAERHLIQGQWRGLLDGLQSLTRVLWINDPWRSSRAESKILQLATARQLGLAVPATLITNSRSDAVAFANAQGGQVICKAIDAPLLVDGDESRFVFADRRTIADLEYMADKELAPFIVQQAILPKIDVRVTVVGDEAISASTRARTVDWRRDATASFGAHRLPRKVAMAAVEITRALGLTFAGIDFAVDSRGKYWFLELNPSGEWGWLQAVGLPIAEAIVRELDRGPIP